MKKSYELILGINNCKKSSIRLSNEIKMIVDYILKSVDILIVT